MSADDSFVEKIILSPISQQDTDKIKQSDSTDAMPFISVMILNYKHGDFLGRALEACAAQTFRDFEIVMINNGAIDNTEQIYQNFCKNHPEVKSKYVFVKENQGIAHGWNEGLRHSQGEYVMFNDADDWMDQDCLEKLASKAKETGADRVTGQFRHIDPKGKIIRIRRFKEGRSLPTLYCHGVIFKRSVILQNELYFPERFAYLSGDIWFTHHFAALENNRGVIINHTVYNFFYNSKSVTRNKSANNFDIQMDSGIKLGLEARAEAWEKAIDQEIKQEIEYLAIKETYASMFGRMSGLPWSRAKQVHRHILAMLQEAFPDWVKNPFIWPLGNGYDLLESCGLFFLIQMERIHAVWIIYLMGDLYHYVFKFRK